MRGGDSGGRAYDHELLLHQGALLRLDTEDVEADRLGKRAALADGDDVSVLDLEGRGEVGGQVAVALLETVVLLDVVQVVTADRDRALHLGRHADTAEDAAADRHVAGERALVVNVRASLGLLRRLHTEADVLPEPGGSGLLAGGLLADKDGILLLKSLLVLDLSHGLGDAASTRQYTIAPGLGHAREKTAPAALPGARAAERPSMASLAARCLCARAAAPRSLSQGQAATPHPAQGIPAAGPGSMPPAAAARTQQARGDVRARRKKVGRPPAVEPPRRPAVPSRCPRLFAYMQFTPFCIYAK